MQGTRSPPDRAAEGHQVTGRSFAQIHSRLFELSSTIYLAKVLHFQVRHPFYPERQRQAKDTFGRGYCHIALHINVACIMNEGNIHGQANSVHLIVHFVCRLSQEYQGESCYLSSPAAGMLHFSEYGLHLPVTPVHHVKVALG
jgi:hypothetical protein